MGRSLPRSSPRTSEWAVPRVAGRFSDSETSWVLAGGAEGSFLCSPSSRFPGRGGGVGSLPRAWRARWEAHRRLAADLVIMVGHDLHPPAGDVPRPRLSPPDGPGG